MDRRDRRRALSWMLPLLLVQPCAPAPHAESPGGGPIELVADGLQTPSNLTSPADGRERIYVSEQYRGDIRVIADGRLLPEPFLDLRERIIEVPNVEQGLLGVAFAPDFPTRPEVYVTYVGRDGALVLARFEVAASGLAANLESEQVLLRIPRARRMHPCGHLEFGPKDRLLYLCVGDGERDPPDAMEPVARDPDRPLGKILRLDVEVLAPAGPMRPASTATPAAGFTIWARGLQDPWRFTFDPATGDAFIPDVSRFHWDEINFWPAAGRSGADFGWPLAEGNECITTRCEAAGIVWPIYEYSHRGDRCAVIGGAVYRGSSIPDWQGVFVFGDLCSGEIWALRHPERGPEVRLLADLGLMLHAFGTRFDGEILIADRAGAIWRLRLPDIADGAWVSADRAMFAMIAEARRSGFSRAKDDLATLQASRAWRWSQSAARAYRYLTRTFE